MILGVLAMFEQRITDAAESVEGMARTVANPGEALVAPMETVAGQASDRGMFQTVGSDVIGVPERRPSPG